jgi:ferredoxin-nitrite reductase
MIEYKKHKGVSESFESFNDRVLSQYSSSNIGFVMKLGAYLRAKNIDVHVGFTPKTKTGKNEEFEVFELGRKLYYNLTKKEPYSAYERFTNVLKSEELESIDKLLPDCDKNIADMLEYILNSDENKRAVVFSELNDFIAL